MKRQSVLQSVYYKNIMAGIRAFLVLIAITMNMELIPYDAIDNDNRLIRAVVTIVMSMDGFDIVWLLAFPILFLGMKKVFYEEKDSKTWSITIPACLFSVFMVIGYTFYKEDSYYLLFGDQDLGQTIKTILQLIGYYNLFYISIHYLYKWLDNRAVWKVNETPCKLVSFLYGNRTFLKIFLVFLILWMPYVIACFPGYVQGDTPDQLRQVFGMEDSTSSYLNLLSEDVTLNNHHPVLHTLLLGGCFKIGHSMGNDNLGIFLYTMMQYVLVCVALASGIAYMGKIKLPYWIRNTIFAFYLFVPVYVNFSVLSTKDVIYSVFCMWYMLFMAELLLDREMFYKDKKKVLYFFIVCLLGVFMRHNGIYVILFSLPFILLLGKKHFKFVTGTVVGVLAVYLIVGHVIYPMCDITAGSRREALSVPLQQTGRYIYEYEDDLTEEERAVIERVIDIEQCKSSYSPRLADPVKSTFNEDVTGKELRDYFVVWFKMFFKHPGCYVEAFLNNTYGYFYYGDGPAWKYTETESENVQGLINPAGFDIHHIEALHSLSTLVEEYEKIYNQFPVVSLFNSAAFYTWVLVILFMLLWRKQRMNKVFLLVPAIVSLLVCFAGPLNGIDDFRYMFPIAFMLPVVCGIEMHMIYMMPAEK